MSNIKIIVLSVASALAVALGFGFTQAPSFGALSGPDIASPYLRWGGVAHYSGSMDPLAVATTTVCAIQSPAATSTLQAFQIRFDVSSTTASIVTIAKADNAFATTTQIGTNYNIAANAQAFIQASTTATGSGVVFGPNQWVVTGMRGGTGTFSPTGTCQAKWISS